MGNLSFILAPKIGKFVATMANFLEIPDYICCGLNLSLV